MTTIQLTKKKFKAVLEAAGIQKEGHHRFHVKFEELYPEEHHRFLQFLKIPENQITRIRKNLSETKLRER